ncbi:nitrite reductase small subunit NirD [Neobacillus ginsengisoli]|uniref:Nitrite reductase (NADH) small subunit n=1 Tax=Neobacillus ginsengisoli TaxID=904295 RepID=A0ABT9XVZ8_9BACI|nr:nitrite reductase small subunit NirD [Neobacillus ginsengisoli]MDQ0199440.1 nitrite reductase (NADH) small subunit [Neobacillus ginsengisoli]
MINKSVTKLSIGTINEFQDRIGKTVRVGDIEVAVFKLSNGSIRAVENRCPHKGGVLSEGIVSGEFVFCPMHDWKICLDDGKVQEPDTGCVKTYQIIIDGDEVYLLIEEL